MSRRGGGIVGHTGRMIHAARTAAGAAEAVRKEEWDLIAEGVRAVCREIQPFLEPGALYWRGPLQFVAEQMAPRVAKQFGVPEEHLDDLRLYLLAGINEYIVALVSDFDPEHFAEWTAAMHAREGGAMGGADE